MTGDDLQPSTFNLQPSTLNEWWQDVEVLVAGQALGWGGETEIDAGTPLALELRTRGAARERTGRLGLQLHLPPGPESVLEDTNTYHFEVPLVYGRAGSLVAAQEWVRQSAGQKYGGETVLTLSEGGHAVEGADCVVRFHLSTQDAARYAYMRQSLAEEDPTGGAARGSQGVVGALEEEAEHSPRSRIDAQWEALRRAQEGLSAALPPILQSPYTVLAFAQSTIEWSERLGQVDLSGAAPAPGTPWMAIGGRGRGARSRPVLMPRRLNLRQIAPRVDVPANRYVRDSIELFVSCARTLAREAQERASVLQGQLSRPLHPRWKGGLEHALARYQELAEGASGMRHRAQANWLRGSFLSEVRSVPPSALDLVWRNNPYYRRVRVVRETLLRELRAIEDALYSSDAYNPAASVNDTYEAWLAMIVLRTMCDSFGYRLVSKGAWAPEVEGKGMSDSGGRSGVGRAKPQAARVTLDTGEAKRARRAGCSTGALTPA